MIIQPKISIITVCFNAATTIEDTIISVLKQDYENIEYIIIDGSSTDLTLSIISKYQSQISYFISEKDKGIYDAMNKGLKYATGDWVYFLGSDDILANNSTISSIVGEMKATNNAYFGYVTFKNSKEDYKFKLSKWHLCLRNISHQSIFYPKFYYKVNSYNLRYKIFADHIYNIIYYSRYSSGITYLDYKIAIYNDAGASSNTFDTHYFDELPIIVNKYFGTRYALYVWLRFKIFKLKRKLFKK